MKWLKSIAGAIASVVARVPAIVRTASAAIDQIAALNERAQVIAATAEKLLPPERALQLRAAAATANVAVGRVLTARGAAERAATILEANAALAAVIALADPERP